MEADNSPHPSFLLLSLPTLNHVEMLVKKKVFIVDDFYDDPIGVRNFALSQDVVEDISYHKGK